MPVGDTDGPSVGEDAVAAALEVLGPIGERDVELAPLTTYRVGGAAAVFVRVRAEDDLARIACARRASGLPILVVGRGSNLLVADHGFHGIAVSLAELTDHIDLDIDRAVVSAGSAVRLPVLARRTAAAGLAGFEWAVGVPGSIGGAVRMNAGGHGSDMAASLLDVEVIDLSGESDAAPTARRVAAADLGLRFRGSDLRASDAVLSARLQLAPGDVAAAEDEIREIVSWRRAHQPGGQNAGSVFVNPVPGEVSAGQLIDDCGLRGHRLGTAFVSDVHANFIQADDGGSADDVVRLMQHVRAVVLERTGHAMRSEIRQIGRRSRGDGRDGDERDGEGVAVMGWRARRRERKAEARREEVAGGDPFETSDVRIIPAGESTAADAATIDDTGELADEHVLAELSEAFADETAESGGVERAPATVGASRTTISIGGGDDELPDIAYLDDALAGDDDSGTVFIDDDGRSDAMQPSAAGAATVDARMRQRRIGVRKAANRRRLIWVGVIALLVVLVIGALALLGSGWFAVKDVTVLGQTYADPAAVDEVVADLEGTPVLLVDTGELEDRLEEIPWVETARVSTDFPNSATVELREREPVATVQGSDLRFRILDREGRVLDVIDGQAVALVLVTGPDPVDLLPGQFADVGHAAAAALVTKLTPDVRTRLVSIETTADGRDMGLVLLAADGEGPNIVVRLGEAIGDNDQIEKLVRLERVLDDADGAGVTQIDVSTAETTQR